MTEQAQPTMYSAAAMSSDPAVKIFGTFKDLLGTTLFERKALDDRSHLVHIKGTAPITFSYAIPARILQAFAPDAYAQAFAVPPAMTVYGLPATYSVLILPSCFLDVQALVHILEWMMSSCHSPRPFNLAMPNNFFAWVEILKAAQLLQVRIAVSRVWPLLAEFITQAEIEWVHLETIMNNFPADSKIVRHLAHNVQYHRVNGRLTDSALYYVQSNPVLTQLLGEVAANYQLNKTKKEHAGSEAPHSQRGRPHWRGNYRGRFNNGRFHHNSRFHTGSQQQGDNHNNQHLIPTAPAWEPSQAPHQGDTDYVYAPSPTPHQDGVFDGVHAFNPGEAAAPGPSA